MDMRDTMNMMLVSIIVIYMIIVETPFNRMAYYWRAFRFWQWFVNCIKMLNGDITDTASINIDASLDSGLITIGGTNDIWKFTGDIASIIIYDRKIDGVDLIKVLEFVGNRRYKLTFVPSIESQLFIIVLIGDMQLYF